MCDTVFNDLKSFKVHNARHSIALKRNCNQVEIHRGSGGTQKANPANIFGFESRSESNRTVEKPKQIKIPGLRCLYCKWTFLSVDARASHIQFKHVDLLNENAGH